MTKKGSRRLYGVLLILLGSGIATTLTLMALKNNVSYFRTPTEIVMGNYPEKKSGRNLRVGGLVEKGSIKRNSYRINFLITDMANSMAVEYEGMVPDLFREGQGVVADGKMRADGVFIAERILAKHDEKYMPPEVTKALQNSTSQKK